MQPLDLSGRVVRHTERGFALAIDPSNAEIRQRVDDVAALVNVAAA